MDLSYRDLIKVRIIIAQAANVPPDCVEMFSEDDNHLFVINNYKGFNILLVITEIPTIEQVKESIKDLHFKASDWESDGESDWNLN